MIDRAPVSAVHDEIGRAIVNGAYLVHRELGPGLLENVYEECLRHEILKCELRVATQVAMPIRYDDLRFDIGFRLDMIVQDSVIVEIKSVERLLPVHEAQLLTYLKLTGKRLGYLINFNVATIKQGIKRMVL
jgi:GxxExxY protein